jgi:hypothetical protein
MTRDTGHMNVRYAPALAVALLPLAVGLSSAGVAITPLPRCHTPDLKVYLGRGGAAAGSIETDVGFRNRTTHACFVYGYAGFGLKDARHRVKPSRVTWGSTFAHRDPGRHRVVLRSGRAAFASLAWSDVPAPGEDQRSCGSASAWLQVTPPDERRYRLVRFSGMVCNHGHLTATALQRQQTGPR